MAEISDAVQKNTAKILEYLYRNKKTSRVEISQNTQLTPAAVTKIISSLKKAGLVEETGDSERVEKGGGRSRRLIQLKQEAGLVLGIEANMKGIYLSVTDLSGQPVWQQSIPISGYKPEEINQVILDLIAKAQDSLGGKKILFGGLALAGHYDAKTGTIVSNNLRWKSFSLPEIQRNCSFPLCAKNNIECMALGEYLFNEMHTPENFIFLHVGPGLYASFFSSQKIGQEKDFYMGEIGHTIVELNGNQCECGKKGCLQTYISETWLLKRAMDLYRNSESTVLRSLASSPEELTIDSLAAADRLGDSYISSLIQEGISYLSIAAGNTIILHPTEKIYINSELLQKNGYGGQLIEQIRSQLQFVSNKKSMEIELVPFNPYRGSIGSAAKAIYDFLIQENFSGPGFQDPASPAQSFKVRTDA